jgi:hypothetical protein
MSALLSPAIWNEFPLIFADTGGYLERPFDGTLELGRSALYGTFLALGIPFEFWPNVISQAALATWILALVLRVHKIGRRAFLLTLLVMGLTLATSLPWYVGQLMPDIFLSLVTLAIFLLAFHDDKLTRLEKIALASFVTIASAFHMSILALTLALTLAFCLLECFASRLHFATPSWRLPVIAAVAALCLAPTSNLLIAGKFAFTPGGTTFLFARMVQNGIVGQYLSDHCPDETLRLCRYKDQLPTSADDWIWNYQSPLHKLGWWPAFEPEADRIIRESLLQYPSRHVTTALWQTIEQLVQFKTGEGMGLKDNWHSVSVLKRFAPRVLRSLYASRQQNDQLRFTLLNRIHVPVAWLSLVVVIFVLWARVNSSAPLAATCLIALFINAVICGTFSVPGDRYQSRLIWLLALAAAIALLTAWRASDLAEIRS